MTVHSEIFGLAVGSVLASLLAVTTVSMRRARRFQGDPSLEQILARLTAVDRDKVALVASDYENATTELTDENHLESWQVWELIGGMEGLEALAANCDVLIELAFHVQQWYPEALAVAEQLRLNARELQWHLERLKGAESRGNLQSVFPDYAQRAVAIYFGMTQHVRALYEASQIPGWSQLETAL